MNRESDYFELVHEPTSNVLGDFDTEDEARTFIAEVMVNPDYDGLALYAVSPAFTRRLIAHGMALKPKGPTSWEEWKAAVNAMAEEYE